MDILMVVEFLGSAFSMLGAYFMSSRTKMLYAGLSFFIANLFMIVLAYSKDMGPLFIQMIFLLISSIMIIRTFITEKEKIVFTFMFISVTSLLLTLFVIKNDSLLLSKEMFNSNLEIWNAFLVILGSFLLSSKNTKLRKFAFIAFIVADTTYIYIGIQHNLPFFTLQFLFFVMMSIKGIISERRRECLVF